jgi:hypothetical protein
MRTPFSSRRRLIIAAAVILFAAIIGWLVFSSPPADTLTICYAGVEPGHSNTAGFWVTNSTRRPIYLRDIRVQSTRDGNRETGFENPPPVLDDITPHIYYSPLKLAPGEYRKILATAPTNTAWRVGVFYTSESTGFDALATRIRIALAPRDRNGLLAAFSPEHTNFSNVISNTLPKP